MARKTPIIRAGSLIVERSTGGERLTISAGSDAWFSWLESARTFAFEDSTGRFTARKKRRWGADYWYAFRRGSGRLYETYLGKARDITLSRLHTVAIKLNQLAGRTPEMQPALPVGVQAGRAESASPNISYPSLTKLNMPQAPWPQLVRTAALERLSEALERPLTVVSAPAGYGKTTLLTQWIATLHPHTAWLTLDERDNDPVRFWTHVCAALTPLVSGLLEVVRPPAEAHGYRSADVMLTALIAALPSAPSPTVLVLDDYHEISNDNSGIHEAVAHLMEHLPPQMHLVVTSRTIPPLPLAKQRTRHRLLELGTADLQLTLAETRSFFSRRIKLELPDEEIAVLHARTEGWVAGLQLAALSLQEQADLHGWIAEFSGENRHIFDYLAEEVVKRMPPRTYTFVLQIALLDRLNGSLCDAVTRSRNSQAMLEEMEHANLFIVPLDDWREWYRLHHLFADVLRRHLRLTRPRLVPQLYARASAWCAANGFDLDAIDYALAANRLERAAQLIEMYAPTALASGYIALLRDRLERLPDTLVRERPRLCVAHAYALYMSGERVLLLERVRDAEEAAVRAAHLFNPSEFAILQTEILALRTGIRFLLGESSPHTLMTLFQRALAALPRNHEFRTFITLFVGISQFLDGDVRAASQTLDRLMRASEAQRSGFYVGYTVLYLGIATLFQGRLDDTLALCSRAAQHLAGYGDDDLELRIHLMRGKVLYERNDLDGALDHLRHGISLRYDPAPFLMEGLSTLAYIHLALGDRAAARHVMEQSLAEWARSQVENKTLWVWTDRQIRAHQARLWLLEGNVHAASAWAREVEGFKEAAAEAAAASKSEPPCYVREWEELVLARVYLAEHRAGDALALLDALSEAAAADGRVTRMLEILVLQAIAYDALDDEPAAQQMLQRALELGAPQRFVRVFVEGGPPIQQLFAHIQAERTHRGVSTRRRKDASLQDYIGSIVAATALAEQGNSHGRVRHLALAHTDGSTAESPAQKLTPRERQVIRLIAGGASNKDIARVLVIAPSTAKRHVSNIFATLEVQSRTQAVARAMALDLLDQETHDEALEDAR